MVSWLTKQGFGFQTSNGEWKEEALVSTLKTNQLWMFWEFPGLMWLKKNVSERIHSNYGKKVEIVMNELRKNQNFNFDLQIPPTLPNGT